MKKKLIKRSAIFAVSAAAFLILYNILLSKFTIYSKSASIFTFALVTVLYFCGFVLYPVIKHEKLKRFIRSAAAVCLITFCVESAVFNMKSFSDNNVQYYTDFSNIVTETPDTVSIGENSIDINGDGNVIIDLELEDINALQLKFKGVENTPFTSSISIKDGNFSNYFIKVGEKKLSTKYENCDFFFSSYETLHAVKLDFSNVSMPVSLTSFYFSKALPFRFSEVRFYALFLVLTIICTIRIFEFHKLVYNRKKLMHRIPVLALMILCSASIFFFKNSEKKPINYTEGMDVSASDPYVQMFDALHNGRVNIAIEPSPELLAMENPYDDSQRSAQSVAFAWDRAFYNGKYYSYYGIAPVISFYYPYYMIKGKLPSMNTASLFFGFFSILFTCFTIMAFVKRFIAKPNFLLIILTLISSCFASGIYFNATFSDMYALPGITGTCFLMLCLWCGFEACNQSGKKLRIPLFAVSGLAFAFCLASKPTRALSALILAPLFLEILLSKRFKLKEKLISASSFLVPALAGCGVIMAYNYARFDSPFQFGAVYQLTVSNVNANSLNLSMLPNAIIQYFLQPFEMKSLFPFVSTDSLSIANSGAYIYSDFSLGALNIPLLLAGICVFPFLLHSLKRKKDKKFDFTDIEIKKITYILMLIFTVFLAWFNYCIAGVILSYVCDILPLLMLLSIFVLLDYQQLPTSFNSSGKTVAISVIAILTVIFTVFFTLSLYEYSNFNRLYNVSYLLEDIVCFWN